MQVEPGQAAQGSWVWVLTAAAAGAVLSSCGSVPIGSSAEPARGLAALEVTQGMDQVGVVGEKLPLDVIVRVTDLAGTPVPGKTVEFESVSGDGGLHTSRAISGPDGLAQTAWTLGTVAGVQGLRIRVVELALLPGAWPVDIRATALPGPPSSVAIVAGACQRALPGAVLPEPVGVQVSDRHGNGIAGVRVGFSPAAEGGTVGEPWAETDARGRAAASWQLSPAPGLQVLEVVIGGLPAASLTAFADWSISTNPPLALPSTLAFLTGREGTVYFDNTIPFADAGSYRWTASPADLGSSTADRWSLVANGPLPVTSLTIAAYDDHSGELVGSASAAITVVDTAAGAGRSTSVILVGDSLTSTGALSAQLAAIAAGDAMRLELLGTRGIPPYLHEGRSGWKVPYYTSSYADAAGTNPFWNPVTGGLDFGGYLERHAIPRPDWVLILLGTNDVLLAKTDAEVFATAAAAFEGLDRLVESIHAASPEARVGLLTPPPPSANETDFAVFGATQTRARFKRNILLWNTKLVERFQDAAPGGVLVVPTHISIDVQRNMADALHPLTAGYRQIAEATWAFLKGQAP